MMALKRISKIQMSDGDSGVSGSEIQMKRAERMFGPAWIAKIEEN
jgi:hypothetical protein